MRKQRVRTLEELYKVTQQISEPEITPVLKGSFRIQGPVDEVDLYIETNSAVLLTAKEIGKHCLNEEITIKASGTCNVCAAPCSSCMHFNRAVSFMESKADGGISEGSCGRKETDNCSFSNSEGPTFYKSKPCDDRTQATSETSKIFSTTSSHDSYSENAESKGTVKAPEVQDVSEAVDMPLKLSLFETVEENQLPVEHNINSQSAGEPTNPIIVQRTFSSHQAGPQDLECHGDNISCVTGLRDVNVLRSDPSTKLGRKNTPCTLVCTGTLHGQGIKMAAQAQAADDLIADRQKTLQRSGKFSQQCSQTKDSNTDTLNAVFPHNHSDSPSLNGKSSPKGQHVCSNSKIGNSLCTNSRLKDVEENSSSKLLARPSERLVEPVDSSLGRQMTSGGMDEQKSDKVSHATNHPKHEISKANDVTIHDTSLSNTSHCLETKTEGDSCNPIDDSAKYDVKHEQHGKPSSPSGTFNVQGPQPESQPTLKGDCPDPDTLEDDVKVCDICGDAGREDLLAVCTRCSDGAEHTYCMRIMLNKVPEGDWLCEECKLKDEVAEKADKSETVSGSLKAPCFIEKAQNVGFSFNPKLLPKLDISTSDAEAPLAVKGLQSPQISAKRPSVNADISLLSNKKQPDTSASALTASPSRKSMLSRESSFKNLDAGKPKQGNFAPPSGSQSSNSSLAISRSLSPVPNLSRVQGQLQCTRGSLSRSGSFSSVKPKVKQVAENVPQKPQLNKEHSTADIREGFVRTLGKSASCKNINSGHSNVIESTTKSQSSSLHRPEDSRNLKHGKERVIERKNSFLSNRPLTSSSPASAPSVSLSKVEPKTVQHDLKVNSLSESNVSHPNKGPEDAHDIKVGVKELRKQVSHPSKTFGNHPSSGASNFAEQRPTQAAPREDAHVVSSGDIDSIPQRILSHSSNREEKLKDSSVGSSRLLMSPSKRILRCQRCNETGHSTQFCSVDKVRVSALKPSAERSSREGATKGNKWKDAVDATISRNRVEKSLRDQSEEISSTDMSSEIVSQNHSSSSSSCVKSLPNLEGTADKQSEFRNSTADVNKTTVSGGKQHAVEMVGTVCTMRDGESKPPMLILPEHHSVLFDPLRVSALPDHEYIWQGSFEVKRAGRLPELFDGVQAHLSTCASPKVLKVVTKFPDRIQLEEVACLSSWPLQFQENSPTEENIALFFFAKDIASYEKSYSKLLENLLKNDFALKGNYDGIELLVFPSSKLPEKSQRWNRLFFLWGVFRERNPHCLGSSSGHESKTSRSNYHLDHVHDFAAQSVTKVAASEKESSQEDTNRDISTHVTSMNTEADDLKKLSSLGTESRLSHIDTSFSQRTSEQGTIEGATDSKLQMDGNAAMSTAATDLLTCRSEQTGSHAVLRELRIRKVTPQLCLGVKSGSGSTCQKELVAGSDGRKDVELPVDVQKGSTPIFHSHATDGLSAVHMMTSNPGPPDLNLDFQEMMDVSSEPPMEHQLSALPVLGDGAVGTKHEDKMEDPGKLKEKATASDSALTVDRTENIRWVSRLPNKRPRSHSPEHISQSSGGTSVGISAEMLWRQKTQLVSLEEERESKKIKIHPEVPACSSSGAELFGDRSSSKVHPLLANFLGEQLHPEKVQCLPTLPESPRNSERHFFPFDSGSVMDTKRGSLIPLQILSSDDEYEHRQESVTPNLELALGTEKKPVKEEIHPFSFPLVCKNKNQGKLPDPAMEDGDDESASLSLSLAFPFSSKEQIHAPVPKKEKLMPKRSQANASLLLFGGFADS